MPLELIDVSHHYGSTEQLVVEGVDVCLRDGESVAILGASGAGKSTLLAILGALIRPVSGTLLLDDRPVVADRQTRTRLLKTDFAWIPQQSNLLPRHSTTENVALSLLARGTAWPRAAARAREALEQVGLGGVADSPARTLSGGEAGRAALARALVVNPRFVFADEPTGSLDDRTTEAVIEVLVGMLSEGNALVVATHDRRLASACDRVVELVEGGLVEAAP